MKTVRETNRANAEFQRKEKQKIQNKHDEEYKNSM